MGGLSAAEKRDQSRSGQQEQLGGARADFVANLGRRRGEITGALDLLRETPSSARHRDDLRRRVHALAAGARLLRFFALGDELRRVEERLDEAAKEGTVDLDTIDAVADVVSRMTSLAWGQTGTKTTVPMGPIDAAALRAPSGDAPPPSFVSALVVGKPSLAEALSLPTEIDGAPKDHEHVFEIEQTEDVAVAADVAKALAPDVIVVDGDAKGAVDLVEALATDPLTEAIPILVVGRFTKNDDAARFVALGVARTLPKPATPGEIRRACATVISAYVKREIVKEPIGEVNVDQLGARLAEELRKGLSHVDGRLRESRVDLGDGTEVLAALWGAVARIRDVVTIRSKGSVRFLAGGPEGAMPLAPWLGGNEGPAEGARAGSPRAVRAAPEVSLQKARVVVADDDPAVVWFLAGVLKAAGAVVYEARDGERAFEVAKHCEPDIVITDVLMPKLDGFALTRALKRDIVLRDVPVVLLSWKEDLLQRVRELGADADGYMRKEASAGAIVQRVRELLRQRRRVAERISGGGEIRGRLDGLTTSTLLRLVCQARPDATVTVRDASFVYEIEIRGGRPVRASRTGVNGSLERGSSVISSLLGAGDGRFVVAPTREDDEVGRVKPDLSGSYADQLAPVIAIARAAQRLLTGANLVRVQRVVVDDERIQAYLAATPEPARRVLKAVADGASPRVLVTSGEVAPRLLEDVLGDAAAHGAVVEVIDLQGVDRLPESTAHEITLLRGDRAPDPIKSVPVLAMPAMTPLPAAPLAISMPAGSDLLKAALAAPAPDPAMANFPASSIQLLPEASIDVVVDDGGMMQANPIPGASTLGPSDVAPAASASAPMGAMEEAWFSSEPQDTALPESPVPPSGQRYASRVDERGDPREMGSLRSPRPHSSALETPPPIEARPNVRTPSPRPVSIREEAARELTPTPSELPPPPGLKPMLTLGSLHPPPVAPDPEPEAPKAKKQKTPKPTEISAKKTAEREATPSAPFVDKAAPILPSAYLPRHPAPAKKDRKALYWVLFALCGVTFAVWARWSRSHAVASEDALIREPAPSASAAEPEASAAEAATSAPGDDTAKPQAASKDDDVAPEDLPLRDYDKVKKGQGMLEVVAGRSDTIYINGKPMGSGPVQSLALKAKSDPYEVKVKLRGEERVRFVTVKDGRLTRVRVAPPWGR